jgi:hypothetical protein
LDVREDPSLKGAVSHDHADRALREPAHIRQKVLQLGEH